MKKLFTIAILFIGMIASAQFENSTVQTRLNTFTSPGAFDDGVSYGLQLNSNFDNGIYLSPEVYYFPGLRERTYFHAGSEIGYNVFFNNNFRMYSGIFLGVTFREKPESLPGYDPNGTFAVQAGIEYQIPGTMLFIGLQSRYQYRTDHAPRDPNYWKFNGFVSIGIILN